MAFDNIPDQAEAARRLRTALRAGRLAHAFLFAGSVGTGRMAVARELAAVLLCGEDERPDDYCGRCQSCRLMAGGDHPDYYEAGVPEGRQSLPIATVRELQRIAALKPVRAARRVFVLREAERMTIEAANCLLKTLEEPPGGSLFILVASSLRELPETIRSRCQVVRFAALEPERLAERLVATGADEADARWLARRAWGSPGLAERLREAGLPEFNRELIERLRAAGAGENFALSDWLGEQASAGSRSGSEARAALQELLECALVYYRDLALAAAAGPQAPLCNAAEAGAIAARAAGEPAEEFLERADLVLEAIEAVGANAQRRLALDDLLTRLGRRAERRP